MSSWDAMTSSDGSETEALANSKPLGSAKAPRLEERDQAEHTTPTIGQPFQTPLAIRPKVLLGTESWLPNMLEYTATARQEAVAATRTFLTTHLQFGIGTELLSLQLLGVPFRVVGAVDKRQVCRAFCARVFRDSVDVCTTTVEELVTGSGLDRLSGLPRNKRRVVRPDLATARLPVYVASKHRPGDASTSGADACVNYEIACEDFFHHLEEDRPRGFWVDTDPSFRNARATSGQSVMEAWMAKCSGLGYVTVFFNTPGDMWAEDLPRATTNLVGFSKEIGGSKAAAWFHTHMAAALKAQRGLVPHATFTRASGPPGILDHCDDVPEHGPDSSAGESMVLLMDV